MLRSLPLALLLGTTLAASPIPIAPQRIVADVSSRLYRPSLGAGSNGRQFFLAWEDRVMAFWANTSSLRFRTYDAQGAPQQSEPRPLAGQNSPSVVWTGGEWFVASARYASRFSSIQPLPMLTGTRVAESGDIAGEVTLASSTVSASQASVAWNGSTLLASDGLNSVIASGTGNVQRKVASFWPFASAGGTFLVYSSQAAALAIVSGSGDFITNVAVTGVVLAATGHGSEYAVLTSSGASLTLSLVTSQGVVTSATPVAQPGNAAGPCAGDVVWSGGSYVIALGYIFPNKRFCLVRGAEARCLSSGFEVSDVALAANDSTLFVAWSEQRGDTGVVLTATSIAGTLPATESATVATVALQPELAPSMERDPGGTTIVWSEPDVSSRAMVGGVDMNGMANGAVRAPRTVGILANTAVRLARGTSSIMSVWSDGQTVFAREINDSGALGRLFPLGEGTQPSVAFDGDDWLIVWRSDGMPGQIMSAMIRGRILIGPVVREVAPSARGQEAPAVASRGDDFLVTWQEAAGLGPRLDAVLVSRDGITSSPTMKLAALSNAAYSIAAAGSGSLYLVSVQTLLGDIQMTPVSTIPGILVNGARYGGVLRVRPRAGGGFAILSDGYDRALRFTTITSGGDIDLDTRLPLQSEAADFIEVAGRVDLVYETREPQPRILFDSFVPTAPRRRVVGVR